MFFIAQIEKGQMSTISVPCEGQNTEWLFAAAN
jgi:hypothetical protein